MTDSGVALVSDQDGLSASIEARLAQEVADLRMSRGRHVQNLVAIYEDAGGEFDKLVAASVLQQLLGESQALLRLSQFFLESYQLRLMREQRVLSLEDLFVELRHRSSPRVEVPDTDSGFGDVFGSAQSADGGADV